MREINFQTEMEDNNKMVPHQRQYEKTQLVESNYDGFYHMKLCIVVLKQQTNQAILLLVEHFMKLLPVQASYEP